MPGHIIVGQNLQQLIQKLDKPNTFTTLLCICLLYSAKSVSALISHHQGRCTYVFGSVYKTEVYIKL